MEKTILQIFGDNVRRERLKRKLSQEELANVADLHRTYIGMIERAEKNITMLNAQKIADSLNISLTELLINKDEH
jgi:transcriptional regulator with XRE-family HTH domain